MPASSSATLTFSSEQCSHSMFLSLFPALTSCLAFISHMNTLHIVLMYLLQVGLFPIRVEAESHLLCPLLHLQCQALCLTQQRHSQHMSGESPTSPSSPPTVKTRRLRCSRVINMPGVGQFLTTGRGRIWLQTGRLLIICQILGSNHFILITFFNCSPFGVAGTMIFLSHTEECWGLQRGICSLSWQTAELGFERW